MDSKNCLSCMHRVFDAAWGKVGAKVSIRRAIWEIPLTFVTGHRAVSPQNPSVFEGGTDFRRKTERKFANALDRAKRLEKTRTRGRPAKISISQMHRVWRDDPWVLSINSRHASRIVWDDGTRHFPKSILYPLIQHRIRVWLDIIKLLVSMYDRAISSRG